MGANDEVETQRDAYSVHAKTKDTAKSKGNPGRVKALDAHIGSQQVRSIHLQ